MKNVHEPDTWNDYFHPTEGYSDVGFGNCFPYNPGSTVNYVLSRPISIFHIIELLIQYC